MGFIQLFENRKSRRLILWGALIAIVIVVSIFNDYGALKRLELENEKIELINTITFEQKRNDSLRQIIKYLETDTLEIERIAREKYGMIKPGEKVYFIGENKK